MVMMMIISVKWIIDTLNLLCKDSHKEDFHSTHTTKSLHIYVLVQIYHWFKFFLPIVLGYGKVKAKFCKQ